MDEALLVTRVVCKFGWGILCAAALSACGAKTGLAIDVPVRPIECELELSASVVPSERLQLAIWVEREDRFETLFLTDATARHGLGNRPGALQMNSAYRWPVGRRENVLPGWAGARLAAGGRPWRRVVFWVRASEGFLSSAGETGVPFHTEDPYFCLPYGPPEVLTRDHLDATSCASIAFHGDVGRYITEADIAAGYSEPYEPRPGSGIRRALSLASAYPPRRDREFDADLHPDALGFSADALEVMPDLDAVSRATPARGTTVVVRWRVPRNWSPAVSVFVEANSEGDYFGEYGPDNYPTPSTPAEAWDSWARGYGYPYRGQPSVIFDVPVELPPRDRIAPATRATAEAPTRMGSLDASLATFPIDDSIVDDPVGHPGSGADRLFHAPGGERVLVEVVQVDCRFVDE